MPHGLGLLGDRDMVLGIGTIKPAGAVGSPVALAAPLVEEEFRGIKVLAVAGGPIQLAQSDLDFLVARRVGPLAGTEDATDQIGVLHGNIEEGFVAGDLIMRDRRFQHMTHAVLFMFAADIGPAHLRLPVGYRVEGVQVSVLPLGPAHDRDQLVQVQPHHRIRMDLQGIGRPLHDLVDVGIVEIDALVLALLEARRLLEVADSVGLFTLLEAVTNRDGAVGFQPGRPEAVPDVHLIERHRLDVVVALRRLRISGTGPCPSAGYDADHEDRCENTCVLSHKEPCPFLAGLIPCCLGDPVPKPLGFSAFGQ